MDAALKEVFDLNSYLEVAFWFKLAVVDLLFVLVVWGAFIALKNDITDPIWDAGKKLTNHDVFGKFMIYAGIAFFAGLVAYTWFNSGWVIALAILGAAILVILGAKNTNK